MHFAQSVRWDAGWLLTTFTPHVSRCWRADPSLNEGMDPLLAGTVEVPAHRVTARSPRSWQDYAAVSHWWLCHVPLGAGNCPRRDLQRPGHRGNSRYFQAVLGIFSMTHVGLTNFRDSLEKLRAFFPLQVQASVPVSVSSVCV